MASTISTKPFLSGSRTAGFSGLAALNSNLRYLSSMSVQISIRPRIPKRLQIQADGNAYGNHFRATTYEESHGGGFGCVIDGCPPCLPLSKADIQVDLDRRRPGQKRITTDRKETDTCEILSGVSEGMTTGTPIHVFVPNTDQRGHGGGRSSARETIGRVASGAIAKKILREFTGIEILAYVSQVHKVVLPEELIDHNTLTLDQIENNIVRCPDPEYAEKMIANIDRVRVRGDSIGGAVTCIVRNCPRGLGSPVFARLVAELAKAVMSLPAAKGFQFEGPFLTGSEHNDVFYIDEHGKTRARTNHFDGIRGGISNGEEIINMRIDFKPTATIRKQQQHRTWTRDETHINLIVRALHDPCVAPRAVLTVEAVVALVLVDQLMAKFTDSGVDPDNFFNGGS